MRITQRLFAESIVIGAILSIVGIFLVFVIILTNNNFDLDASNQVINKMKLNQLLFILFISGAITHIILEATGVNHWYTNHGNAVVS